jgi:hypothetical protein
VVSTFVSTSERIVGVQLNLDELEIRYFINQKHCKKQKIKKLTLPDGKLAENLEWYPIVKFKASG